MKYGRCATNNDADHSRLAREFLGTVEASAYLPANLRFAEMDRAIDELLTAHQGWNNFYNAPPLARALAELVGQFADIPVWLRQKYVHALVEVFLGNGSGIAWNAPLIYREFIARFDVRLAKLALASFAELVIAVRLQHTKCQQQWTVLLDLLEPKISSPQGRRRLQI